MTIINTSPDRIIQLGYEGEDRVTVLRFRYGADWLENGEGIFRIRVRRHGEHTAYNAQLVADDSENHCLLMTVTNVELSVKGSGEMQVVYSGENFVKKSPIYSYNVSRAVDEAVDPPAQDVYTQIIESLSDLQTDVRQIDSDVADLSELTAAKIGDLTELTTEAKTDLVSAINEVNEHGGASVTVDSALSDTSENPVQNKVVTSAIRGKADTQTVSALADAVNGLDSDVQGLQTAVQSKADIQTVSALADAVQDLDGDVRGLQTVIQRVASGAPVVVGSVSDMTDTDQIYVLSTDGNWYYHNGTAWVAGGEYGAVATDKTLTLEDSPADAKAVGDKISPIKSDVISIKNVLELDGSGYVFVDSVAEMTGINTRYVLSSNGHVYEAQEIQGDSPNEFSLSKVNWRIYYNAPYGETANGYLATDYIPFTADDIESIITISNAGYVRERYDSYTYGSSRCVVYNANKTPLYSTYFGGRVYGYRLPLLKVGNDLTGSIVDNPTLKAEIDAVKSDMAYVAFCWPLETASQDAISDDDLSAITAEQVTERNFGIYISTHKTTTWQFVDTGVTYSEQSAIQRIDGSLRSINGQITGLDARTTALEEGVVSIDTRTTTLETEADDFDARITTLEEGGGQEEEQYKIELTVGAWSSNGYTPTSDSNQLRNVSPIPLNRVSKIEFGVPTGLSKVSCRAIILDNQNNLVASFPWGEKVNLSAMPINATFANICISAHDSSGTGVTTISPYKDSIAGNMTVISADAPVAIQAIRVKINNSILHNSYIDEEIDTVIKNLQNVQWSTPNALTLGFMTDMHYMNNVYDGVTNLIDNLAAVQIIANECSIGGLMMGGDNLAERSTRAGQILNLKDYGSKVRKINIPVFSVKGNHDDSSISGYDSSAQKFRVGYNIFDAEYYLWTEKPIANNPFVVFPPDPTGLYYYVDFPAEKVRLICLNSVDIPYIDDGNGYLIYTGQHDYGYSNVQLNWVAHTALDFSDKSDADLWGVVTMQHIIDNPNIPTFSGGLVTHNGAQMYNIFKAFKARTTYASTSSDAHFPHNISVDFTNATQELMCRISGHSHADRQVLSDDGLHISTMQAGPNSVGNNEASDGTIYTKTAGTGKESAMDFFTFDRTNKKVFCTRYGAGVSREISWV